MNYVQNATSLTIKKSIRNVPLMIHCAVSEYFRYSWNIPEEGFNYNTISLTFILNYKLISFTPII